MDYREVFFRNLDALERASGNCAGGEFWSALGRTLISAMPEIDPATLVTIFQSVPDSPSAAKQALAAWRTPGGRKSRRVIMVVPAPEPKVD